RHDGEAESGRFAAVRNDVHHRQAAGSRGRAPVRGAHGAEVDSDRSTCPENSSVRRMLLVGSAAFAVIAVPHGQAGVVQRHAAAVDTATSDFVINGLHVILRRNTATDVVAANLYLLGGVQQ